MSNPSEPTAAQAAFDALPVEQKASLAASVFAALEYDAEGNPGSEWDSDTMQTLGDVFHFAGITFTAPAGGQ